MGLFYLNGRKSFFKLLINYAHTVQKTPCKLTDILQLARCFLQAKRDLNPQPHVLETRALPN